MKEERSIGIGFLEILAIVFITLKLLGKISWSWWWVLCPLWIPFAFFLVGCVLYAVYAALEDNG